MHVPALAREQLGVGGLGDERVAEGVAVAVGVADQQAVGPGLAQGRRQRVGVEPGDRLQQRMVDAVADRRGDAQQPVRVVAERRQPLGEQVGQRRRQRARAGRRGRQQLLGGERVARRARVDALDELGVGRVARRSPPSARRCPRGSGARGRRAPRPAAARPRPASGAAPPRSGSSSRKVATSRTRSSRRLRARKASRSSVDGSAQWTSSTASSSGAGAARRPTSVSRAPSSAVAPPSAPPLSPSSGSSRASCGRASPTAASHAAGPRSAASAAQRLDDRQQGRVAAVQVDAAAADHADPGLLGGRRSARRSRVVLPTPASPPMSRQLGCPAIAFASACRTSASSEARPTRTSLVVRRTVAPIISQGAPLVEIRHHRAWESGDRPMAAGRPGRTFDGLLFYRSKEGTMKLLTTTAVLAACLFGPASALAVPADSQHQSNPRAAVHSSSLGVGPSAGQYEGSTFVQDLRSPDASQPVEPAAIDLRSPDAQQPVTPVHQSPNPVASSPSVFGLRLDRRGARRRVDAGLRAARRRRLRARRHDAQPARHACLAACGSRSARGAGGSPSAPQAR